MIFLVIQNNKDGKERKNKYQTNWVKYTWCFKIEHVVIGMVRML